MTTIFIVSGGTGFSGEQLLRTALAQFSEADATVEVIAGVRRPEPLESAVARAATANGLIVYTLVDADLRLTLERLARNRGVLAVDLMGPLLAQLQVVLGTEPLGRPGLYREQNREALERTEAIDYTLAHDDGRHPEGWRQADIVLVGVSRVGKTPISLYLASLGWKVANVPLVGGEPPPELFQLYRRRVVGLTIDPDQLLVHRRWRERRLKVSLSGSYSNPLKLREELEAARRVFLQGGFAVVDITNKPVEVSAKEILEAVGR
ncbi:MAG: pyruvate, water dikinase regulatory protein [Candidatus Contendobacter sp.]|nr:pyruvate, water dikinase regulatory protein [Candidatus Contendobacter sp.]MDS4057097.1 pyruvate, water dikinase regulatory protein [Candidatus Contendobacter sp.]